MDLRLNQITHFVCTILLLLSVYLFKSPKTTTTWALQSRAVCWEANSAARELSERSPGSSVWIPICNPMDNNLWAERQCYLGKEKTTSAKEEAACWLVDPATGFRVESQEPKRPHALTEEAAEARRRAKNPLLILKPD